MKKPVNYISASQIGTFLTCPLAYKKNYLEGRKKLPPNIYMSYGTAVHHALAENYKQKIESKKDLSFKEVYELFTAKFDDEVSKYSRTFVCRTGTADTLRLAAGNSLDWYMKNVAPTIQPKLVEHKFEIKLKNFPITIMGYIDLVTDDDIVVDHKTAGKNWRRQYMPSIVDKNIQLTLYAVAFRKLFKRAEKGVRFDVITRDDNKTYPRGSIRTEKQILDLLKMATKIEQIIELGVFIPNFHSCSQCPYKDECDKQIFVEKKT
jgi:putative RecB family exonuclease